MYWDGVFARKKMFLLVLHLSLFNGIVFTAEAHVQNRGLFTIMLIFFHFILFIRTLKLTNLQNLYMQKK